MNVEILKNLTTELKAFLNKESVLIHDIIRSEQAGDKPQLPYCSYKITSKDNLNYNNRKQTHNADPTKYSESLVRKEKIIISFIILGLNIFELYKIADLCYDFLNIESSEFQRANQIKIELLNQVQDRSIFLETDYENRVGFDFEIRGNGELIRTIDAVDLNSTTNQVQLNILD